MLKKLSVGIIALLVALGASLYLLLKNSLPQLDGQQDVSGLTANVKVSRDQQGIANIEAQNRLDLARATGFVHAQERFYQMDLLRRNSAGELSALFGDAAFEYDKKIRLHRFRHRASQFWTNFSDKQQSILKAYSDGVNQGLAALDGLPFEYLLLQQKPQPWTPEDTLLALYSMYLDLQYDDGRRDRAMTTLRDNLPPELFAFLTPEGSRWDAPIDNSGREPASVPDVSWPMAQVAKSDIIDNIPADQLPGSNNWAVSGELTPYQSAMLADDMHLGIRVPNIWYRATFNWQENNQSHQVSGVSLPGTPLIVVGSNGHVAWGFTNSYGDWSDVIRLRLSDDQSQYLTPEGYKDFVIHQEKIEIAGKPAEMLEVKETIWGPVIDKDSQGNLLAYRWVAHDQQGANLNMVNMELTRNIDEAMAVGNSAGIPAQNLMLADSQGNIAWTIAGPMPIRAGFDGRFVSDWSDGSQSWQGYRSAEDYPRVVNPQQQRLWTANSRVVGGEAYDKIGDGGYALGARAQQIRDGLLAKSHFTEQDLLDIQLDDKALFLQRWRELMLEQVLPQATAAHSDTATDAITNWAGRAAKEDLGYLLVRQFRMKVRELLFQPMKDRMTTKESNFHFRSISRFLEEPMWLMVTEQPDHLLPEGYESWQTLLQQAFSDSLDDLNSEYGDWRNLTWGQYIQVEIKHPMSNFIPMMGMLTDMPNQPQDGDSYMPRVGNNASGASQRLVVAPGHEDKGILHMPSSQTGHPLSPYFGKGHDDWLNGRPTPLLPGKAAYQLTLTPAKS